MNGRAASKRDFLMRRRHGWFIASTAMAMAGRSAAWLALIAGGDSFWFSLYPQARPPRIEYWGNQIIWRLDCEARWQ
jgi:hypothetical protein